VRALWRVPRIRSVREIGSYVLPSKMAVASVLAILYRQHSRLELSWDHGNASAKAASR
jgi:hypothetical protein